MSKQNNLTRRNVEYKPGDVLQNRDFEEPLILIETPFRPGTRRIVKVLLNSRVTYIYTKRLTYCTIIGNIEEELLKILTPKDLHFL